MKKIKFRNLLAGLSFTTAFFVFQACYGPPQDHGLDVLIEGQVTAAHSGDPVEGIKVSVPNESQNIFTDSEGKFSLYTIKESSYFLQFQDIDGDENDRFKTLDTIVETTNNQPFINIELAKEE